MDRTCKRHEEKQTDVALAISAFSVVSRSLVDRIALVTADTVQVPMVKKAIRRDFPTMHITLDAHPNRAAEARELGAQVHERRPYPLAGLRGASCRATSL